MRRWNARRPRGRSISREPAPASRRFWKRSTRLLAAHVESDSFLEKKPETKPAHPEHIGRYVVTGELGRGAMGIVYEAIDPLIGRSVAVKVIYLQALASSGDAQFPDRSSVS